MQSAKSADSVFVLDTGSTDHTVQALRDLGATVETAEICPWRFDHARNLADRMAPLCDVVFSLDLDEIIVEPDWLERIKSRWQDHNRGRYKYVWSKRPDGTDGNPFFYEKIYRPDQYEWHLPCHEDLRRKTPGEDRWCDIDITVEHYPDGTKSRGNYLPLLALSAEENPNDPRVQHYYARELFFRGQWEEARRALERYLSMRCGAWNDERCISMSQLAHCHENLGDSCEAERWHLRACAEAPHLREPFIEASKFYNARNQFPMGYALAKRALMLSTRPASYVTTPYAWNEGTFDCLSVGAYYMGLKPEAVAAARKAHELAPWDGRLAENVQIVERMCPEVIERRPLPKVVPKVFPDDPSFALAIVTYGSVAYVRLALAVRAKFYPDVPALVVDDCSKEKDALAEVCAQYGADFHCNAERFDHTRGDMMAFATALKWSKADVLVKMSRRFVPTIDWRPSLRTVVAETQHATYAGVNDATWGLRTECIALDVRRWTHKAATLEEIARTSTWLWVEKAMQDLAVQIVPWGTGNHDGAALWDYPGLGKWCRTDGHLWHDTASHEDYAALGRSLGLDCKGEDFRI